MSDVLDDISTLRRRVRADRDPHWFLLAVLGGIVLLSSLAYQQTVVPAGGDTYAVYPGPHDRYWLGALPAGILLTLWWHRRHGSRVGLESPVGRAVVAAVSAVVAYAAATLLLPAYVPPAPLAWIGFRGLGALLVIAVLLLALAVLERAPLFGAVAVVYATVATVANVSYLEDRLPYPAAGTDHDRWQLFPSLYVPAAVLLLGAVLVGLRARARRAA